MLLFGTLAPYGGVTGAAGSLAGVRLAIDAGLLLIMLVSMAIGQSFTLQYAGVIFYADTGLPPFGLMQLWGAERQRQRELTLPDTVRGANL